MKIERFEDIEGWQLARQLTRDVYELTKLELFSRDFGLLDQIRRAAGSSFNRQPQAYAFVVSALPSAVSMGKRVRLRLTVKRHAIRERLGEIFALRSTFLH